MTKTFDPSKPVQTREGKSVRIICTDYVGPYPFIYLIKEGDTETTAYCNEYGTSFNGYAKDLFNIRVKHERWINIYPEDVKGTKHLARCLYETKKEAEKAGRGREIATVKVEWEE